jgi:hypothetical protein
MSELKVYHHELRHNEYEEFYLKYEADKVIAELKESVKGLILDNYLKDKETRHNKYKHCLDMSDKCVILCHKAKDLYRWAEDENLEHHYNRKIEFFARWHRRWLKIAEQFKEAK